MPLPTSYFGLTAIPIPSTFPSGLEVQQNSIVAQNVNPFTHQSQVIDWNIRYNEVSVTLPPMIESDANYWLNFFYGLKGTANIFAFSAPVCVQFPFELSIGTGFAVSGASSTITFASTASPVDNAYTGQTIMLASGTGAGQATSITAYVGSTRTATVTTAWSTVPDSTTVFTLPKYFRLKNPNAKWSIKTGCTYYFVFEASEVII